MSRHAPDHRPGVDAEWLVLFAFLRLWPRAAQAERTVSVGERGPWRLSQLPCSRAG